MAPAARFSVVVVSPAIRSVGTGGGGGSGAGVPGAVDINCPISSRPPVATLPARDAVGATLASKAARISAAVALWCVEA